MNPVITFLQELDDLTYLINYPFQPDKNSAGQKTFTMQFKTKEPPIIKTFEEFIEQGTASTTINRTIHWDQTYLGANSDNIQASSTHMLLVACYGLLSGASSEVDIHASDTVDTADGTKILDNWVPITNFQPPPIPFILDVDQFFTVSKINGISARNFTIFGYTVELPSDFALS